MGHHLVELKTTTDRSFREQGSVNKKTGLGEGRRGFCGCFLIAKKTLVVEPFLDDWCLSFRR